MRSSLLGQLHARIAARIKVATQSTALGMRYRRHLLVMLRSSSYFSPLKQLARSLAALACRYSHFTQIVAGTICAMNPTRISTAKTPFGRDCSQLERCIARYMPISQKQIARHFRPRRVVSTIIDFSYPDAGEHLMGSRTRLIGE